MNLQEFNDHIQKNTPEWIDQDLEYYDIESIQQGGCESGAYMPAVTYHEALEIMSKHGDEVLEYLEENYGELPPVPNGTNWSGIAVYYLSSAMEVWANQFDLDDMDDEEAA